MIASNIENPYIFLLYNHSEPINVTDALADGIVNGTDVTALQTFVGGVGLSCTYFELALYP